MYAELNRAKIFWFVVTGVLFVLALTSFGVTILTRGQWSLLIGAAVGAFGFPAFAMAASRWEEADEAKLAESSS